MSTPGRTTQNSLIGTEVEVLDDVFYLVHVFDDGVVWFIDDFHYGLKSSAKGSKEERLLLEVMLDPVVLREKLEFTYSTVLETQMVQKCRELAAATTQDSKVTPLSQEIDAYLAWIFWRDIHHQLPVKLL